MVVNVGYNGRNVKFLYIKGASECVNLKETITSTGINYCGDIQIAEDIASFYLIETASLKRPNYKLEKMIIVGRDAFFERENKEAKMILTGIPVFEKIKFYPKE